MEILNLKSQKKSIAPMLKGVSYDFRAELTQPISLLDNEHTIADVVSLMRHYLTDVQKEYDRRGYKNLYGLWTNMLTGSRRGDRRNYAITANPSLGMIGLSDYSVWNGTVMFHRVAELSIVEPNNLRLHINENFFTCPVRHEIYFGSHEPAIQMLQTICDEYMTIGDLLKNFLVEDLQFFEGVRSVSEMQPSGWQIGWNTPYHNSRKTASRSHLTNRNKHRKRIKLKAR